MDREWRVFSGGLWPRVHGAPSTADRLMQFICFDASRDNDDVNASASTSLHRAAAYCLIDGKHTDPVAHGRCVE